MAPRTILVVLLLGLGGCVALPTIDVGMVGAPKSVAIVDIPDVRPLALIGVLSAYAPGPNQFHFSERSDMFFAVPGSELTLGFRTNATGLIPNLIDSQAAATQKKAETFGAEILKVFPGFDLRAEFMKALRTELVARGASVRVLADGRDKAPRLRWPAADADGKAYPSGSLDSSSPVDADIVLEVCPVVMYNSPGPLNNYTASVTVGIALYNGRTRQFLGRQILRYVPIESLSYARYDSLVEDLRRAVPPLRDGLVSLAPLVADLATGQALKQ